MPSRTKSTSVAVPQRVKVVAAISERELKRIEKVVKRVHAISGEFEEAAVVGLIASVLA